MANQDAIQDRNQVQALLAHSGTAGTAETRRVTSSGTPGALDIMIVGTSVDISGAAAGTNVNIVTGTQQTLGTVDEIGTVLGIGGTVAVSGASSGTVVEIEKGTITNFTADIPGGTTDLVTRVGNIGTIESGTVTVTNPAGTQYDEGTAPGTISGNAFLYEDSGGTLRAPSPTNKLPVTDSNVGTDVNIVTGTINVGTTDVVDRAARDLGKVDIAGFDVDLPGGTVDLVTAVTTVTDLTSGSVTVVGGTVGTIANVAVVHNAGTVAALPDLPGGTVDIVAGGTIVTDPIQFRHADEFATVVSSGTSVLGTIKAAVAGSAIYITDLIVSAGTATNVEIASGGTSTPIIGTLHFADQGGIAAPNFKVYPRTASGSALVYKQSTNGPLTITCNGYVD